MVVVLSEDSYVDPNTINGRELRATVEAARMFGCRIYPLPTDFEVCETAENALAYLPECDPPAPALWAGYIPTIQRYTEVYDAAAAKGVRLVNSPREFQTAMEFDRFYPLLGDLTPESRILSGLDDLSDVESRLGYPVFVKGAIKSNKDQGWARCVAHDRAELTAIAESLLARDRRSLGKIIVRRLFRFRTIATDQQDFPIGREYRAFVYRNAVIVYGFYWDEYRDAAALTPAEDVTIRSLAVQAAERVGTPFVAVDLGQLENGEWIVIEVSDGQFTGLSHVTPLELWSRLSEITLDGLV